MGVSDVIGGFQARRVFLPSSGVESWLVIGPDLRPVAEVDEYLAWLTSIERSTKGRGGMTMTCQRGDEPAGIDDPCGSST